MNIFRKEKFKENKKKGEIRNNTDKKTEYEKWKFNSFPSSKNVSIRGILHKIWNIKK